MKKTGLIYLGALLAVGIGFGAGCGDSGNTGSGGSGGTGAAGGAGGSGAASSSSSSSSSSSGTTGPATCDSYCATIMANCKTDKTTQYTDLATCKATCAAFPQGAEGDMAGYSLECRAYHAGAAKDDAVLHCPHAGLSGGDLVVSDDTAGPCGTACDGFCDLEIKTCVGGDKQYADKPACMAECKQFPSSKEQFNVADFTQTDDINCRLYHIMAATTMAPDQHCTHAVLNSTFCTMAP